MSSIAECHYPVVHVPGFMLGMVIKHGGLSVFSELDYIYIFSATFFSAHWEGLGERGEGDFWAFPALGVRKLPMPDALEVSFAIAQPN